jgi:hypothetical protein
MLPIRAVCIFEGLFHHHGLPGKKFAPQTPDMKMQASCAALECGAAKPHL